MGRDDRRFDGFVFVTPEYNHSTSGVLKNAIDYLYAEWNNKAMGVVCYGAAGGARAAEHLRLIAGSCRWPTCAPNVALSLFTDFENFTDLTPGAYQAEALDTCSARSSPGARRWRRCAGSRKPPRGLHGNSSKPARPS